jgi:hypothetical protein
VFFAAVVVYSLTQHSPTPRVPPESQAGQQQSGQSQPPATATPALQPPAAQPPAQSGFASYQDSSGLFQVMVPPDWLFRRAESDMTLDTVACHLVHVAVFAKEAERSDLVGWVSEGIRVSIYLPPAGQAWQPDWAAAWQKKSIAASLLGYTKFQNTAVEPVQLGNILVSTTAVMGEAKVISEPELARLYAGFAQKFLVTVEVAMPSSKRPMFESVDEAVRRTFQITVP